MCNAYNPSVCSARRALYFLEPMLLEPGLGTSPCRRDHLALDEPKACADLAHLNPGSGCESGGIADTFPQFGAGKKWLTPSNPESAEKM